MKSYLGEVKAKLCSVSQRETDFYDLTQLEYLINTIDGFLMDYLELNEENFNAFMEELIVTAIMQVRFDLLDLVKPFEKEEVSGEV